MLPFPASLMRLGSAKVLKMRYDARKASKKFQFRANHWANNGK
jgi:hypothetical protein